MSAGNVKIKRALLSVSDKTGLVDLAIGLGRYGIEIISTGGTARALRAAGIFVTDISAYTSFPEILDGRVKTLHPKVHGGLLGIRGNKEHEATMAKHGIYPIDLVVVNLYPFEATVAKVDPSPTFEEAIEQIDIGGPSMLRSGAKNHRSVTVVIDPTDYARVLAEMAANSGNTTETFRRELAKKVFAHTSLYDAAIANYL
jgi:phosphoribosylaminoimidazolecarboxamide formyltransferase/IMP cyclohydrolase